MKILDADIDTRSGETIFRLHVVAPTLGWRDVNISARVYITPPADGLQEVILSGKRPTGLSSPALQLFVCETGLPNADWVRGVKVIDAQGDELLTLYALVDAQPIGNDNTFLRSSGLKGDKLHIEVAYGGGCRPHHFQLAWDGTVEKTFPPRVVLTLSHNAHEDPCKALLNRSLQFDLSERLPDPDQYQIIVSSGGDQSIAHNISA